MSIKKVALLFLLVDFLALTGWAMVEVGLSGFVEIATANPGTILLTVDLLLALAAACVWMLADARKRGVSALPYIAVTALTGSAGWILYLLLRPAAPDRSHASVEGSAAAY